MTNTVWYYEKCRSMIKISIVSISTSLLVLKEGMSKTLVNCTLKNTIYALPTFDPYFDKMSEYSEKCAKKMGLKPA